ncbi:MULTISPECIES: putative quinol monooxygenase [Mycobacteroides]|uniref:putative quinol monooxygenase n=1 Tax=Mycobacteroides TaxID=670516 RepID=UPI0018964B4A|nr:antibiotic biosynthesis monooxygenase family protein [Mycobacteroides immunogenum]WJR33041.1 antibiotic biosynthesis monooxygenase [Mycobacteroides immunogenum]
MTVQVIMELTVKENRHADFREFMVKILPHSRSYKGCVCIELVRNQDNPAHLLVMEKWNSRQDYERYLSWRMESGLMNEIAEMIEDQPKLQFFDPIGL